MGCNASNHRCETMSMYQMFLPYDSAYEITAILGESALVEFRDLNSGTSSHNRLFKKDVQRCVKIEQKLEFITTEMKKDDIKPEKRKFWIEDDEPFAPNPTELFDVEVKTCFPMNYCSETETVKNHWILWECSHYPTLPVCDHTNTTARISLEISAPAFEAVV
ncbi:V-type proton ATPase 116 kDa subunit a3-like [Nilaparvata lugens]|uniref:V-type proton ATPase 116 kDa subunit a3-like n=1 Tax=Nilaparvata lugens TaxID=108931 RepID=UPI00193EA1C4|nr:V-type proton ATPase 116 kDa subunit a3-like [Nilaparvata lugens]